MNRLRFGNKHNSTDTMKLTTNSLLLFLLTACLLSLVSAWDEDPRCTRRSRRAAAAFNSTDPRLVEDGLLIEEIRSRPRVQDNTTVLSHQHEGGLRGSRRKLADVTVFQLKMYHEEGYCWQEEWEDRKWCLECEGSTCGEDDYLWVKKCDEDEKEQRFIYRPVSGTDGGHLSPYYRQDLCWERTRVNAHQLRPCSNYYKQIIVGIRFDDKFEMHPNRRPNDCLEQHHDPKDEEIVRANDCEEARDDHTNFWIMISKRTGTLDDDGGGGGGPPDGSDTVNFLGGDYCKDYKCKKCQGDCDSDSECEGGLKCFQRNGREKVPGCSGSTLNDLRGKDFCYDPNAADVGEEDGPPGSNTINSLGGEYCDTHKCRKCQGDCDDDSQCEGSLRCFQRNGLEKVPGCSGSTTSGSGLDFCYDPDDADGGGGKEIKYYDGEYCDFNTCGECEGDCDDDSSCAGSLKCFQRDGNEPIPGCSGGDGSELQGKDFCYQP